MSISLLYHAFNIKGVRIESAHFIGNAIIFSSEMTKKYTTCPHCESRNTSYKGPKVRKLRMGSCGRKQSFLKFTVTPPTMP